MAEYTIGRLARLFGLSRSTLLYYDSIGLLQPKNRSGGEYRYYGEKEAERLRRIRLYRRTGLSLAEIARALDADTALSRSLENRLSRLNEEIAELREQQRLILKILQNPELESALVMNRATWSSLLAASGFSEEDMRGWHVTFERHAPEEHRLFLKFLCIPEEDIRTIRSWADGNTTETANPNAVSEPSTKLSPRTKP